MEDAASDDTADRTGFTAKGCAFGLVQFAAGLALFSTLACVYGTVEGLFFGSSGPVFITDSLSFVPAEQPVLNGIFYAANLIVLVGAVALGLVLVVASMRLGCFGLLAGGLMSFMAVVAVGLLVLAPQGEFDTGQKVVFGLIALAFGSFGGMVSINWVFQTFRSRPKSD